jgi:hypothetical protein
MLKFCSSAGLRNGDRKPAPSAAYSPPCPKGVLGLAYFGRSGLEKIGNEPLHIIVGGQINNWIVTMTALLVIPLFIKFASLIIH